MYQESQRQRIRTADREGKSEIVLAHHDVTFAEPTRWKVECDDEFYHKAYGSIEGCTPSNSSYRHVRDFFASAEDCRDLIVATESAMQNLFHRGGTTSLAPCHKQSQDRLGVKGALLFEFLLHKTRLQIMRDYNLTALYLSGALLTRLIADPPIDKWDMDPSHAYWNAHVDKANIPTYDYSALLYLSTRGADFEGGELAFIDDDADRVVEPRAGRLVSFTSGPENLHRVRRVTRGRRHVLAMWFTCSADHKYRDEEDGDGGGAGSSKALKAAEQQVQSPVSQGLLPRRLPSSPVFPRRPPSSPVVLGVLGVLIALLRTRQSRYLNWSPRARSRCYAWHTLH